MTQRPPRNSQGPFSSDRHRQNGITEIPLAPSPWPWGVLPFPTRDSEWFSTQITSQRPDEDQSCQATFWDEGSQLEDSNQEAPHHPQRPFFQRGPNSPSQSSTRNIPSHPNLKPFFEGSENVTISKNSTATFTTATQNGDGSTHWSTTQFNAGRPPSHFSEFIPPHVPFATSTTDNGCIFCNTSQGAQCRPGCLLRSMDGEGVPSSPSTTRPFNNGRFNPDNLNYARYAGGAMDGNQFSGHVIEGGQFSSSNGKLTAANNVSMRPLTNSEAETLRFSQ